MSELECASYLLKMGMKGTLWDCLSEENIDNIAKTIYLIKRRLGVPKETVEKWCNIIETYKDAEEIRKENEELKKSIEELSNVH